MLVLSRKVGERIVIADNIVVTVAEVRSGRVRLAFNAPRDVWIHREEIHRSGSVFPALTAVGEDK